MDARRVYACFALVCITVFFTPQMTLAEETAPATTALTNDGVVKMVKLGFNDETIGAKISQAPKVDFHTEPDDLGQLQEAGVSQTVIRAMISRMTPAKQENPPATSATQVNVAAIPKLVQGPAGLEMEGRAAVRIVTKDKGQIELASIGGSISTTYAFVTVLMHMNFPDIHSGTRTTDRRPSLFLNSAKSPTGRYFLVRAEIDKGDGIRSVKLGNMGMFGAKGLNNPDKDNQVPCEVKEERQGGVWRMTPVKDLKPGEYGLWVPTQELYDFGVD